MNDIRKTLLSSAGVDINDALARFMNNESLLDRFMSRFPQDKNYALLKQALAQDDAQAAYAAAHSLKGVAGNLSMRRLYVATCAVVEPLRIGDLAAAKAHIAELDEAYQAVIDALSQQ